VDVADGGRGAGEDHNGCRMSCNHSCSREESVDLVLLDSFQVLDSNGILSNTLTLSSEDSLVDGEAVTLNCQNSAVCWDPISNSNSNDVSRDQLFRSDPGNMSIAYNFGLVGRVFLERSNRLFGAALLRDTDDGIEDEDCEDLSDFALK
jgi:hypothetical protein